MTQLRAMGRHDATPRLHELNGLPTLVASGAHDPIAPPRLGRALGHDVRLKTGVATLGSSMAPRMEIAGVMMPSP